MGRLPTLFLWQGVPLCDESGNELVVLANTLNADLHSIEGTKSSEESFFLADYGPTKAEGTTGTVGNGNILTDPAVSDWTAKNISTADDMVVISPSVDSPVEFGV